MKNKIEKYRKIIIDYVLNNLNLMFREKEGFLKYPYLDPAGQYTKNLWDWDSYFTSVALFGILNNPEFSERVNTIREKIFECSIGSLMNFFEYQSENGTIPISMKPDNPDVFQCRNREKGIETNMAKPIFGQYLFLIYKNTNNLDIVKKFFNKLMLFYNCYEKHYKDKDTGLFIWGSDMAIGIDDDPTTWSRPHFSSANIFLNCLMYVDLISTSKLALKLGKNELAAELNNKAKKIYHAIQKYCWDERDGFYYTVDVQCKRQLLFGWVHKNLEPFWKVIPIKIMLWTGFLPMWCKIATMRQSKRLVYEHLINKNQFYSKYGIRSLSIDEKMYQPEIARGNPSNWLGPIWIIANYLIWKGLKNYHFYKEQKILSENIISLLGNDIEKTGCMHEYYSPETGKGIIGKGFLNWNILILSMIE